MTLGTQEDVGRRTVVQAGAKKDVGMAQVMKCLPHKLKALSSNPSTVQKKNISETVISD
jgi:hypothetical protein